MIRASGAALFLAVSNLVVLRFLVLLCRRRKVAGQIAGAPDRALFDPVGKGTSGNLHSHSRSLTNVIGARGHRPVKGYSGVPLPGNPSRTRCPRTPVRAEFSSTLAAFPELQGGSWTPRGRPPILLQTRGTGSSPKR